MFPCENNNERKIVNSSFVVCEARFPSPLRWMKRVKLYLVSLDCSSQPTQVPTP